MRILLIMIILPLMLSSKPIELLPIDQQIINHTYNEEFEKAESLSLQQIKAFPNSPKYYYYNINSKLMEYYKKVSELDVNRRDEGRKALNKELLKYCEEVIKIFDGKKLSIEDKFYFGTIYGYLARVYGMDGSWWSAFRSGKKAKNLMEEIIKTDQQFYDAYLVLGMLNYYSDRMSGITSFIAGVLGFSGDRETGLNQVTLAYERGKVTFGQSALTLIEIYSNLEDNKYSALKYYEEFLKQFPQNKRILNAYCNVLINIWDIKKVEEILNNDNRNLIDDNTKARYYDQIGKSNLAIQHAEKALENEKALWRGAANYLRYIITFNSWLIGDIDKVRKYEQTLNDNYKEIFGLLKNNEKDVKWLNQLSIIASTSSSVSMIENYVKDKPKFSNVIYEDQYNALLGRFYFKLRNFEKAEQYFNRNINSTSENEKYLSLRYLIDIYMINNVEKPNVKNLISVVKRYDNDRLKFRIRDLEKKYNI